MDIALKQRLVGATVLIALAVVVLPMMLGGGSENGGGDTQAIELPPQPAELDFETRRYPLGEEPGSAGDSRVESRPGVARALPEPRPESLPQPAPRDAAVDQAGHQDMAVADPPAIEPEPVETAPEPVAESAPESTLPAATAGGSHVVQVGSFGSAQNANRLAERLGAAGYAVLSDTVRSANSTVHRVRVGPYASEADATLAVDALTRELGGIKPRIIALSPVSRESSATPSAAADPLARWVVQVGSFSSASNAESLVARLRLESHSAYQEEVSGASGTIYRVRVGPYLEREDALRAEQSIKDGLSLDGVVLSVD
jgi:DedD protein